MSMTCYHTGPGGIRCVLPFEHAGDHCAYIVPSDRVWPNEAEVVILRDRFAMAALTGALAHEGGDFSNTERAAQAYRLADAMLEARKEER